MTARSSTFAWETPWAEEPGGLQSTGPHRVRATKHTQESGSGKCWDWHPGGRGVLRPH